MTNAILGKEVKLQFEAPACALERWNPAVAAKKAEGKNVFNIYSTIGEYGDGEGTTPKKIAEFLKAADGAAVEVNINSPGGDFFEGVAIHSLLKNYSGDVKVNVVGLAASAASVVAIAGSTINIAPSGFLMIHKSWTVAMGNEEDMTVVANMLRKFDDSMAALYEEATGMDKQEVMSMMGKETWLTSNEALEMGFAHQLLEEGDISVDAKLNSPYNAALKKMDVALAKAGMPRSKRRELLKQITSDSGTQSAAKDTMPRAGDELVKALEGLHKILTSKP